MGKTDSHRRVFSCPECGIAYEAYPPDDLHTTASLEEPDKEDVSGTIIKIVHDCSNCKAPITLYWYNEKPAISFLR